MSWPVNVGMSWPVNAGMSWPGAGGLGFNNALIQTRTMERSAGLGNNIDLYA